MGRVVRLVLGSILLLGAVRAAAYFVYAAGALTAPLETFHLEAKMVLLAQRVQAGVRLYPDWQAYPHVANFFGPAYFVLVGLLGRLAGADIDQLFAIGRGVTFASALLTTLGLAWFLYRRYGRRAAWAGGLLSLGSPAMIGFSVMVRPDMMAETLGIAGFFLSGHRTRPGFVAGCVLLVLAVLTKQTAAIFLLAAAVALVLEGQGKSRRALGLLGGCMAALLVLIAAINAGLEPNLARSLVGESRTPWSLEAWSRTFWRVGLGAPDLFVFPMIGLVFWSRGRFRDPRLIVLAIVVLASSLGASGKRGADLNYYLSLRVVEALAIGTLWSAAASVTSRGGRAAIVLAATLGGIALWPSTQTAVAQAILSQQTAGVMAGPAGRSFVRTYQRIIQAAEDPGVRLLTDSGLIDLHQKERAAFGDPWLFRLLVETGQIRPLKMQGWIDSEAYDLVVTTSDLFSPGYVDYEFGLPMVLVERLRIHYVPAGFESGLFFYRRREAGPTAPP